MKLNKGNFIKQNLIFYLILFLFCQNIFLKLDFLFDSIIVLIKNYEKVKVVNMVKVLNLIVFQTYAAIDFSGKDKG